MPAGPPPPAAGAPGGLPPRRPNLWRQATSTTGGLVALIVASGLALLLVMGVVGAGLFVGLHAWGNHHGAQLVRMAGPGGAPLAPGQRQQLNRERIVPGPGLRGNGLGQAIPGFGALGSVEHGEFTVAGANGQATVMTLQRGTVTAASASSATVRSTDGFTATYSLDSSTRVPAAKLANGDTVLVVATKSGSKAVLIRVARVS
jgi:hypothetical protein